MLDRRQEMPGEASRGEPQDAQLLWQDVARLNHIFKMRHPKNFLCWELFPSFGDCSKYETFVTVASIFHFYFGLSFWYLNLGCPMVSSQTFISFYIICFCLSLAQSLRWSWCRSIFKATPGGRGVTKVTPWSKLVFHVAVSKNLAFNSWP